MEAHNDKCIGQYILHHKVRRANEGAWRRIKVKIDTLVGDRTVGSISLLQPS
ncbi:hypothetical protein [Microcoleus sp. Pol11C3]|uniref:hypothetical protein n=1 Tax=Microcoleus sp. Pol11C3 TaxID=3055390 RepID=UPI002FD42AF4